MGQIYRSLDGTENISEDYGVKSQGMKETGEEAIFWTGDDHCPHELSVSELTCTRPGLLTFIGHGEGSVRSHPSMRAY